MPELQKKQTEPYAFYLNHAYLITSEAYKKTIKELFDYLYQIGEDMNEREEDMEEGGQNGGKEDESSDKKGQSV